MRLKNEVRFPGNIFFLTRRQNNKQQATMLWAQGNCEDCDRIINPRFRLCFPCKRVNDGKKAAEKEARDTKARSLAQARHYAGLCCECDNELDDLSETKCLECIKYYAEILADYRKRKALAASMVIS